MKTHDLTIKMIANKNFELSLVQLANHQYQIKYTSLAEDTVLRSFPFDDFNVASDVFNAKYDALQGN